MDKYAIVYAGVGSNLGNKLENIEAAIELLNTRAGQVIDTSRLYSTAAQYVCDQPSFFNAVIKLQTTLSPTDLLIVFKSIEKDIGRTKSTLRYGPRVIDVDILYYNNLVLSVDTMEGPLILPHKRIPERDFVLAPFCDLSPQFQHPVLNVTMLELYNKLLQVQADDVNSHPHPVVILPLQKNQPWDLSQKTYIMGILNITPDSFSQDGTLGQLSIDDTVERALEMVQNGADIIDIGGESSRPGATPISLEEELERVIPVIRAIREKNGIIPISIDTTKSNVASAAIEAGANLINDISGGKADPLMLSIVAKLKVPIVIMHMKGSPQTMSALKQSYSDKGAVVDITEELNSQVEEAIRSGIFRWNIILDPGIGFAKDKIINLMLLRKNVLATMKSNCGNLPLLLGASRKKFIGEICGEEAMLDAKQRIWGTASIITSSVSEGVDIVRVHDVKEMAQVAKMADAMYRSCA